MSRFATIGVPCLWALAGTPPLIAQQSGPIPADSIVRHVAVLASDELAGRAAGSDGYWHAARYVAVVLARAGFQPLIGDGDENRTFIQSFDAPARGVTPPIRSFNVVAYLEGSDPVLKREFVSVGAHLDGLGTRNGMIHNGANDNATGSAVVLEIARALAATPPRRSVLVGLWGAEEVGMQGSRYFVEHPVVELGQVIAHLNFDGVGRYDRSPGELVKIYALGASRVCSTLEEEMLAASARTAGVEFDREDKEGWFRFSDHYNFHQAGVPSVFFTDLGSEDYHQPTDDVGAIDGEKLALTAWVGLELARTLADRETRVCPAP